MDFNIDGILEQMEEDEKNLSDESDSEEGIAIRRRVVGGDDMEYSRLEGGEHSKDGLHEGDRENGLVKFAE